MVYDFFPLELSFPLFHSRMEDHYRKRSKRRYWLGNPQLEAKRQHKKAGRIALSRLDLSFPWEASPQERASLLTEPISLLPKLLT